MPITVDKLIVTNRTAMERKYGRAYLQIVNAVKRMIAKDKARGVTTRLVALDDPAIKRKYRATPVSNDRTGRANEKEHKVAVDALYEAIEPAYLMILGAPDVVPHQSLKNPTPDEDRDVPSDLPYACDAPYSRTISKFTGPTRVVGRLPGLTGAKDPDYLEGLIETAAGWKASSRDEYEQHLAVSAKVWKGSTGLSIKKLFGSSSKLKLSPPSGPNWTKAQLRARSHFINCHGATPDDQFYGQLGNRYPVALRAAYLGGKITEGAIIAAECCYGAELYDPSLTNGQPGICNTYLHNRAYGYFGSSTIAYGPANGNGAADLVCQYYLKHVLEGASSGRAALTSRQDYVDGIERLDPIDLKTLAQFSLMGDPSVHPVAAVVPHVSMPTLKALSSVVTGLAERAVDRIARRHRLVSRGLALQAAATFASISRTLKPKPQTRQVLLDLAKRAKIDVEQIVGYRLAGGMQAKSRMAKMAKATSFCLATGVVGKNPMNRVMLVALEQAGKLVGVRELVRR